MALALQAIGHKRQNAGMLAHAARDRPACRCSLATKARSLLHPWQHFRDSGHAVVTLRLCQAPRQSERWLSLLLVVQDRFGVDPADRWQHGRGAFSSGEPRDSRV